MIANRFLMLLASVAVVAPLAAHASSPVAVVEDTNSNVAAAEPAVEPFAPLALGQTISLGAKDRLVIDYFASCARETITGGIITVGLDRSAVVKGKVRRERVACDGLPPQTSSGIAVEFRNPHRGDTEPRPSIKRTIYALCPVANLDGADHITFERLDMAETTKTIVIRPNRVRRDGYYDFAAGRCPFVAGGTYKLTINDEIVEFTVDASARRATGPLVGRLLLM